MSGHPLFPSVEKIWRKVYRYLTERRKGSAYDYQFARKTSPNRAGI
jgi:hypothetical protein